MGTILLHIIFSKSVLLCFFLCFPCNTSLETQRLKSRQRLQVGVGVGIGIGIGSGSNQPPSSPEPEPEPNLTCPPSSPPCPSPPSQPPSPPRPPPHTPPHSQGPTPSDFPNLLLYQSYIVIQRFKRTIYSDPNHITMTWSGPDLSKYKGFFLGTPPRYDNTTPAVASVDFNGFRLGAPTLAGFIDYLPDLALFHANSNDFGGTLPNLTHLSYLYELDLSNNKFTGNFPSAVLSISKLTFLDLRYNSFTGMVPPSVFHIHLDVLFLNNNLFKQTLTSEVGRTSAAYLTLANNDFTGEIPTSIAAIGGTLIEVLFLGNRLSGCLPAEIGQLQSVTVFDAGFNEITGPIPKALGCLTRVEQLNFAGNFLYGDVPEEVCRLGNRGRLLNLSLSDNYFSSLGYGCMSLLRRGILDVRRNCIEGCAEQRMPEDCAHFLTRRKSCPSPKYVPCYNGWDSSSGNRNTPVTGTGYAVYSALWQKTGR